MTSPSSHGSSFGKTLIVTLILVVVVWILCPIATKYFISDPGDRGVYGDMYGSVNALFSGLAFATLLYTVRLQHQQMKDAALENQRTSEALAKQIAASAMIANQQSIIMVERDVARIPTVLKFHGVDKKELDDLEVSPEELAYVLSSFTANAMLDRARQTNDKDPFPPGSYRYAMLKAEPTRKLWPILKRLMHQDSYIDKIEATIKVIEQPSGAAPTKTP